MNSEINMDITKKDTTKRDAKAIINTLVNTSLSITFYTEDEFGKLKRFTKTISDIKEGSTDDQVHAAATAIAEIIDNSGYDVKIIKTNLLENN